MASRAIPLLVLFSLAPVAALPAPRPEVGFWQIVNAPGPMLFIESSGDTLLAVLADVEPSGNPRWQIAAGPFSAQGFRASLMEAERGSCLTCAPLPTQLRDAGVELRLEFVTPVRGFMRIGSEGVQEIERADLGGSYREPRVFAGRGLAPALLPEPLGSWIVFALEWRGGLPRWFSDRIDFGGAAILGDPPQGFAAAGHGTLDRAWWPLVLPDPDPPVHYRYRFGCQERPGGASCELFRESDATPLTTVFRDLSPLRFGTVSVDFAGLSLPPAFAMLRMPPRIALPEAGFWLDPERPGSGWLIDRAGENLAVLEVGFDSLSRPSWWLATGKLDQSGLFRAARTRPPPATAEGETLSLGFSSVRAARLAIDGAGDRHLQRFAFGSGYSDLALLQDGQVFHLPRFEGRYALLPLRESAEGHIDFADWPRLIRIGPARSEGGERVWTLFWEDGPSGAREAGTLRCPLPAESACELAYESSPPWGTYVGAQPPTLTVRVRLGPADLGRNQAIAREAGIVLIRLSEG